MNFTIQEDCGSITITSALFNDWWQDQDNYSLTITVTINCCSDPYEIILDSADPNLLVFPATPEDSSYVLLPEFFEFDTESLKDGIYHIQITNTENDTGSYTQEQECVFIDCETKCMVFEYIRDNEDNFNVHTTYLALQYASQCDDCDCKSSCVLYERLAYYLGLSVKVDDCGCVKTN
jgi:hypothetical protein